MEDTAETDLTDVRVVYTVNNVGDESKTTSASHDDINNIAPQVTVSNEITGSKRSNSSGGSYWKGDEVMDDLDLVTCGGKRWSRKTHIIILLSFAIVCVLAEFAVAAYFAITDNADSTTTTAATTSSTGDVTTVLGQQLTTSYIAAVLTTSLAPAAALTTLTTTRSLATGSTVSTTASVPVSMTSTADDVTVADGDTAAVDSSTQSPTQLATTSGITQGTIPGTISETTAGTITGTTAGTIPGTTPGVHETTPGTTSAPSSASPTTQQSSTITDFTSNTNPPL